MTLTKAAIINKLGEQQYREECDIQREFAKQSDYNYATPPHFDEIEDDSHVNIPQDIADLIWEADVSNQEKIDILFAIYDDMPAYGLLYVLALHYGELSKTERHYMWDKVRERLSATDSSLVRPLQYTLLVDYFENPRFVEEAWTALTNESAPEPVLRSVLRVSGPVPWHLKLLVYNRLLKNPQWHKSIFESLLSSIHDVLGDIEARSAQQVLKQLELHKDTKDLATLEQTLKRLDATTTR